MPIFHGVSGVAVVTSSGAIFGDGLGTPLRVKLSPTGYIYANSSGLYIDPGDFSTALSDSSFTGSGTLQSPIELKLKSSGLLSTGTNGVFFAGSGGALMLNSTSATGTIPVVTGNPVLKLNHATPQTVTDIVGQDNQFLVVLMNTNTTVQHTSGVIHLWGGSNFKPSGLGGSLTLYHDAGIWKEIARSSY